jgi:hypothetical protein
LASQETIIFQFLLKVHWQQQQSEEEKPDLRRKEGGVGAWFRVDSSMSHMGTRN